MGYDKKRCEIKNLLLVLGCNLVKSIFKYINFMYIFILNLSWLLIIMNV